MGFTEQLPDINIKILLVDLDKNEFLQKYIKHRFGINYKLSVGIDIVRKDITFGNELNGTLSIWDVSGENVFEVVKDLYRKEEGITLIVFDLTKLKTHDQMNKYLSRIRQFNLEEYPYVLIGKKPFFLKKDGSFVYSDDAKQFAKNEGCVYLEVSSEINNDIDNAFNRLAKRILRSKVPV
jgi:GTPase SAR1 family protein